MSGTLSKRAQSRSTTKSTAQAARKKPAAKVTASAARRASSVAIKKTKAAQVANVKNKKKPVVSAPKVTKAKRVSASQKTKRVQTKATKKVTTSTKVVLAKPSAKTAKSKVVEKIAPKKVITKVTTVSVVSNGDAVGQAQALPLLRRQAAQQALRVFEQAVKVFNRREFEQAKELFENLQHRYPHEVDVIARAQTYIQVCNLKLSRLSAAPPPPRNADEFYDRGVVALNVGNLVQARTLFEKALRLRPDDSHTLYSLAATHAQAGSPDQALNYLQLAVQKQPRFRQRALNDNDFSTLHEDRRFLELLGAASPFDRLESRRDAS